MEPIGQPLMWIIAIDVRGWIIIELPSMKEVDGSYQTFEEAKEAAETRSYRIGKGWPP